MLARAGATSPLGKLIHPIKTNLADATYELLERRAFESGKPVAEVVRTILEVSVHGLETVQAWKAAELRAIAGDVPELSEGDRK